MYSEASKVRTDQLLAHTHRHPWVLIRSYAAYERSTMGFLLYFLRSKCVACRSDTGEGKSFHSLVGSSDDKVDSWCEQIWHIMGPIAMGTIGFVISMSTLNVSARYIALFLQAGSYAGFIVFYSWISSSFPRPPAKRAVAIALINAFSQLGNVAGSYVWALKDNGYRKSYGIVLAMFGVTVMGCWAFRFMLVGLNKRLEAAEVEWDAREDAGEQTRQIEIMESPDEALRMRKGFRYLI